MSQPLTLRCTLAVLAGASLALSQMGCQSPDKTPATVDTRQAAHGRHVQLFGDADLPRKIGTVEAIGLEVPKVSPDGRQILCLRTDRDAVSMMTLLGSPDPQHTPSQGTLSIWLRPVQGAATGRRVSRQRWAHSPVWSDSGQAIAYVVNEPPASRIVHLDLVAGKETLVGLADAVNCLPRFDGDDRTLLFCAGKRIDGPLRVYRQGLDDAEPTALTSDGADRVLPVLSATGGGVLCAEASGENLTWTQSTAAGGGALAPPWGLSARPAMLQTWAGVAAPLSPNRESLLFYDIKQDRICVLHLAERIVRRHRARSIAACWLDDRAIAVATPDGVFAVNTTTGLSLSLFSGQWIPCRYVPADRRLILLGRQTPRRFAIWEVVFKPKMRAT